jgi:hypothetical protein
MSQTSNLAPEQIAAHDEFVSSSELTVDHAFAAQLLAKLALENYIIAQSRTEIEAPDGYLVSVRALRNGALTEVWNADDPNMRSDHELKKDTIRYAPKLRFDQYGAAGKLMLADTWKYGNLYFDFPRPCYINNGHVQLGLLGVKEYRDRSVRGDPTLLHYYQPSRARFLRTQ